MNEIELILQSVKKAITSEYTKSYPDVKEEEVVSKSKRGKLVFETIDQTCTRLLSAQAQAGKKRLESAPSPDLFQLIHMNEDDRFYELSNSVNKTSQICEYLFLNQRDTMDATQRNRIVELLKKRERECAEKGYESRNAKIELMKLMNTLESTMTLVEKYTKKYLDATYQQMECQKSVFAREVEMGGEFVGSARDYFKSIFHNLKNGIKTDSIRHIYQAYAALKSGGNVNPKDLGALNEKLIEHSLQSFSEHLNNRKKQLNDLQTLIPILEQTVQLFDANGGPAAVGNASSPPPPMSRMAYMTSKLKSLFRME